MTVLQDIIKVLKEIINLDSTKIQVYPNDMIVITYKNERLNKWFNLLMSYTYGRYMLHIIKYKYTSDFLTKIPLVETDDPSLEIDEKDYRELINLIENKQKSIKNLIEQEKLNTFIELLS